MYSADGVGTGGFVYGHYGRLSDLHNFKVKHGINFTGSVIVLRTRSSLYHVGSMVRNAELFGASAVVLFPDPISYIITEKGDVGKGYLKLFMVQTNSMEVFVLSIFILTLQVIYQKI